MVRHLTESLAQGLVARRTPERIGSSSARAHTAWVVVVFALRVAAGLLLFHFCVASTGNMPTDQGLSNAAFGR